MLPTASVQTALAAGILVTAFEVDLSNRPIRSEVGGNEVVGAHALEVKR